MAKYIEKQALLNEMHSLHSTPLIMGHITDEDIMFKTMVSLVEEQPTADVVEVVRCKDCKYYKANSCFNRQWDLESSVEIPLVREDDYCSYGERKCDND